MEFLIFQSGKLGDEIFSTQILPKMGGWNVRKLFEMKNNWIMDTINLTLSQIWNKLLKYITMKKCTTIVQQSCPLWRCIEHCHVCIEYLLLSQEF